MVVLRTHPRTRDTEETHCEGNFVVASQPPAQVDVVSLDVLVLNGGVVVIRIPLEGHSASREPIIGNAPNRVRNSNKTCSADIITRKADSMEEDAGVHRTCT